MPRDASPPDQAARIARRLRSWGYPVRQAEAVGGMVAVRFDGSRAQDIHIDAPAATPRAFAAAFHRGPPP